MKNAIKSFTLAFCCFYSLSLLAAPQTYIRSYRYQASETDSKLDARTAALSQVKHQLLGELGSYVNSTIGIQKNSEGKSYSQHDIATYTEGFVKTEIIDESWDGNIYFIQAKLTADPEEIASKLNDRKFLEAQERKQQHQAKLEDEYWKTVSVSDSADLIGSYLDKYPDGQYRELAVLKIKKINDDEARARLDAERSATEARLLREALASRGGYAQSSRDSLLFDMPGKVTIVARHDTGFNSKKGKEETTYLLSDVMGKQINKVIPKGSEVFRLTDFGQTSNFLFEGYKGKASKKVCADTDSSVVVSAILEDHEGSKGYLREMKFSLLNCDDGELIQHTFLPEFNKGGRFKREASIKKEFRQFIHDYIDSL